MQFTAPLVSGLPAGSQPLLNWKLKQFAEHHNDSDPNDLRNDTDPPPVAPEIPKYPGLHEESAFRWAALTDKARAGDDDLVVPAAERARYEASFARLASVFPDVFYVKERFLFFTHWVAVHFQPSLIMHSVSPPGGPGAEPARDLVCPAGITKRVTR